MADAFDKGVFNVRMYNVGFGDCFLLSFPVGGAHRHVLVDCGAHPKGTLGNLAEVAAHVAEVTGGELAVVVATHRHQDHIWGFERAREIFRERLKVGEVWLPWVEDVSKRAIREMWRKHASLRAALEARLALAAGPRRDAVAAVLANLKPNDVALRELRTHFGAARPKVSYLHAEHPDLVSPAGIEGLVVKSLGPPKGEDFLKKMDPPKPERWGLAASGAGEDGGPAGDAPFDLRRWGGGDGGYWETEEEGMGIFGAAERALFKKHMSDALDLAFALEDAVNNSSLSLLFLFGGQGVLMPGDAQWGNWKYWLEQQVASELLDQVTVYKVGHHGSHNATPRSLVARLPGGAAVMVPTQGKTPFPTIPAPELMTALAEHSGGRVVRSDEAEAELPNGFVRGEFWTDYRVEVR